MNNDDKKLAVLGGLAGGLVAICHYAKTSPKKKYIISCIISFTLGRFIRMAYNLGKNSRHSSVPENLNENSNDFTNTTEE